MLKVKYKYADKVSLKDAEIGDILVADNGNIYMACEFDKRRYITLLSDGEGTGCGLNGQIFYDNSSEQLYNRYNATLILE